MDYIFFIHSSIDGHLGCFHVPVTVKSTAVNTGLYVSLNYQEGTTTGDMVLRIKMWASLEDSYLFLWSFPSEEVAFRKKRLCIKFIPRDSTEAAICDIRIMGRTKQAPPQYTFIG